MKTVMLVFTMIMALTFNASAVETPYARTCRVKGGQYWAVSMNAEFDTPLCVFGRATVGAPDFAEYKWKQNFATSLKTFLKQVDSKEFMGICELMGATLRMATDSEGGTWNLCKFNDGSIVEAETLARGVNDPENQALVTALK